MWAISIKDKARKEFLRLPKEIQRRIIKTLKKICLSPHSYGKPLVGNWKGFQRYRVNEYRIICLLKDHELIVEVIHVGHRKNIYDE